MLYGKSNFSIDENVNGDWMIAGQSQTEIHVVRKELETIQRNFPVLYAGSDINKIARTREVSFNDELVYFHPVFVDDKGKSYYILK